MNIMSSISVIQYCVTSTHSVNSQQDHVPLYYDVEYQLSPKWKNVFFKQKGIQI